MYISTNFLDAIAQSTSTEKLQTDLQNLFLAFSMVTAQQEDGKRVAFQPAVRTWDRLWSNPSWIRIAPSQLQGCLQHLSALYKVWSDQQEKSSFSNPTANSSSIACHKIWCQSRVPCALPVEAHRSQRRDLQSQLKKLGDLQPWSCSPRLWCQEFSVLVNIFFPPWWSEVEQLPTKVPWLILSLE